MKLRSIDFETTDKPERRQKGTPVGLCEIGYTDVDGATGSVAKPFSTLVNCGVPITPEARGIHHISDGDVSGAITPDAALAMLLEGMEPGDIFVAHNAQFEKSFFSGGVFPWICTLQCARHHGRIHRGILIKLFGIGWVLMRSLSGLNRRCLRIEPVQTPMSLHIFSQGWSKTSTHLL